MKKILAVLIALTMVFTFAAIASAAEIKLDTTTGAVEGAKFAEHSYDAVNYDGETCSLEQAKSITFYLIGNDEENVVTVDGEICESFVQDGTIVVNFEKEFNDIISDEIIYAKLSFWQRLINWFMNLFGIRS